MPWKATMQLGATQNKSGFQILYYKKTGQVDSLRFTAFHAEHKPSICIHVQIVKKKRILWDLEAEFIGQIYYSENKVLYTKVKYLLVAVKM